MTTRVIEDIYPLSSMQRGMLSYLLTEPDSRAYFEQFHCTLEGDLDAGAFATAWRSVIDRHAVLRTAFEWQEVEEPLQIVMREAPLPLLEADWRQIPEPERRARLNAFLSQDREQGFALDEPPLMRLALIREEEGRYRFIWSHHHLLLDGWCRSLLLKEVFAFYEAAASGWTLRLERPRPYRDYIAWWKGRDSFAAEAFWRQELAGWPGASGLCPQSAIVPSAEREGGDFKTLHLNEPVSRALEALGRHHGLTLNTLVLGAWAILLSRYTGIDDATFGVVVSGRPPELVGVEHMMGLFINSLPLRVEVPHTARLLPWLARLQARQAELNQYGHVSLWEIRRWSGVPLGQRLFDSLVAFQNFPIEEGPSNRLGVRIADRRVFEMTEFPLNLVAEPGPGLLLRLAYDRRLFEPVAVARMLGSYGMLLGALAADPDRRLSELPFLADSERAQILWEWNDTDAPGAELECVHQMFARRARSAPERPAVIWQGGSLSFGDLESRAGRLARRLRRLGVGAETVVGLLAERSPDFLAGILGVLKAGGSFLPLDPDYPRERLRYMVEDSGARLVLTCGRTGDLPLGGDIRTISLDDNGEIAGAAEAPVPAPSCLAYVFYTSGSTGRPKGVGVPHGALTGYTQEIAERLRLEPDDRFLQFASPAFDVLIEEVFPVWAAGGAVVLEQPETLSSPRLLGRAMREQGVTVAELPSVYWHEWVEDLVHGGEALPGSLRLLLLGAEKPSPLRLAHWERFGVPLIFVFGLTETTVTSSLYEVPAGHRGELPIGRPVANTRLYVLDSHGGLAPIGVAGELYIGGEALARGYLGRPELTAGRFVPDPWSGCAGARLYRTGDRARYRPDGNLEFHGRLDEQVKVRGFRVELGEIESALQRHPGVREAVVLAREETPGDRRLVAYLCPRAGGEEPTVRQLRAWLSGSLPDYMLPSAFVVLSALPLTPNGKLDRKALPPPEPSRTNPEPVATAPRNAVEELLVAIWRQVLGVEKVGIHDNFFELGGDSILSIQVAARAHGHGLELAPWQLFEQETIAKLAAVLDTAILPAAGLADEEPGGGPLPLTPIQHWFFEQELPERAHWNMPLLLSFREPVMPHLLASVLGRLVEHHEALRSGFVREDGEWSSFAAPVTDAPFLRLDLLSLPQALAADALEAAAASLQASLDLARPPLLRAAWFDLADGGRLLLVAHHLVVDAVSWRILAEDLESGYRQASRGEPLELRPAPAFSRWTRRLAGHATPAGELEHWLAAAGAPVPPLPQDVMGGRNLEASVRKLRVALTTQQTQMLLQELPRAYGVQVQEVLLTAMARAFAGWTGGRRLRIDVEGHGREALFEGVDVSRTVGWFSSIFPVLLDMPETQELEKDLGSVKEQVRRIPGRGIGYGLLRYLGDTEARAALSALPPAPVLFNYLGQLGASSEASCLFALADERIGPAVSPRSVRSHQLEINAWIAEGRLEAEWAFSADVHHRSTIESVAESFLGHLGELAALPSRNSALSKFPLAALEPAALERLTAASQDSGEIEDVYPLSPLQQGMLFHSLYEPGAGMYVAQLVCELEGDLVQGALVRAWEKVLQRHAALRTTFFWQELDRPVQVVFRRVDLPWSEMDLRHLSPRLQRERLECHLAEDRARGFEVSRPPLVRLMLFRTGESRCCLVLTLHQMLLDGWSVPLVLEDVLALYDAERRDGHAELPYRQPYRDYIAWLLEQDLADAEAYWRRGLAGFSPSLGILDARPPGGADEGYGEEHLVISQHATEGARALARTHRVTLNTLIQAAWGLLLGHSTGSRDVVFGMVVSGRPAELPGIESTVGLFINTLPARLRIPEEGTIPEWLRQIQERQAEMRRYEHSPLVEVQRWAGIPSSQPLFESILVFQNYPVAVSLAGRSTALGIRGARTIEQTNYDLTLVAEPGAELRLSLSYPRRFQRSSILRMLRQLQALLEGFGEARRPADLPLLTSGELHQVVHEWNDTGGELGEGTCFHRLFEVQAERTPDRVAVVGDDEHLTYAELDRRAATLARRLRCLGMAPEARVGICLERSPQAVVALLGVLKAGGAYVPLDAAQPRERLAAILESSGASFLLTREALLGTLPGGRFQTICIDRPDLPEGIPGPGPEPAPSQLAYVIFTSGSTGRPKGVAVEHRQLVHYVKAVLARLRLPEGASFATVSSLATDLGNTAVFPALCSGGRLHVVPEWRIADALALEEYCARHAIDCLKIVPSHLAALLSGGRPHEVLPRQRLVLGGEAADRSLVARLRELAPRCEILNHYGPTETTVGASTHALRDSGGELAASPPIGRPLAGVRLVVLGWNLQPAPVGAPGEIHIGGAGVARGYLGDPAQTAERFIPDALGVGARLYRTGDLARLLPDGAVELLGRIDHQVKVRGHRIETTEIEAVLREDESLLETVVIALGDTPGDRRLVAYVVPRDAAVLRGDELRRRVRERLPDFMVPSAFVGLDALPRLSSGKVDRRALPAPEWRGGEEDGSAPRTPAEELLAGIWCEVLGVEGVGRHDDFFVLGGHSLLATQVVSRARRVFGVELALRELFEAPRLADLAGRIAVARQAGRGVTAPPLVRVDRQGGLPLSFAQQRLWFFDQLALERSAYNVPVPVRIEGKLRVVVLAAAWGEIVRRHESLRTWFEAVDGEPVQVIAAPGPVRLPVVDLQGLTGPARDREIHRLTEEDARLPFDLAGGPLWRASLLCLGAEEHVLLATMHHIVIDGWSMEVLGREVRALYLSFLAGEPSSLPEIPVQYGDYAAWQRSWLCGETLAGELAYWRQRLAGAPPLLELPWDRPRPAVQSLRGALVEVRLSPDLSERLMELGRREGATTFIALLAAFQALLARISGQLEVSVGTPVAGRTQVETEGLIGFFVNTLVLRTDLSGDPSFREILGRARETALQAHAHQDLPFEKLVEELSPQRSLSYAPLFQALLMLQNASRGRELEVPGLRLTSIRAHSGTAKFDLTLDLEESPEGIRGVLEHSTDLFDGTTIRRWMGHLVRLLEGAVAAPGEHLSVLPLLSDPERRQLFEEWNDTVSEVPEVPMHRLFEAQVERTPAAVAAAFEGASLTYRDLNARANRLARHLRGLGVRPGVLVGIALERSLDLLVAVIGVLKSGGAYVPLDPAYPAERLSFMLRDSQVPVVLAHRRLAASLPGHGGAVVFLDGEDLIGAEGNLEGGARPEDLAYVIYTSGSTGRPKGVQVPHRALTNFLLSMGREPGLSSEDVVLAVTSLSFDIAALELYLPLLIGGRLEIASREVAKDGMRLLRLLRSSGVTVVQATPSTWHLLLEAGWESSDRLHKALAGGEALTAELAALLGHRADELWNVYGPTETAVWSTAFRVAGEPGPTLPIGRPIANTRIYVVDCWGAAMPIGVPGELCIGGMGIARGYLDRPELTASRFVPDPWGATPGLRLYRTGDLARLRPNGILEFLGRIDHQVKIRGFRIELGEIEAALCLHPAVAQAAVVARSDWGDRRLVAYLSPGVGYEPGPGRGGVLLRPLPESGQDVTAHQLRALLSESLPDYMLPSAFVTLPSLPLTPNGKLDRKALPPPDQEKAAELSMAAATIERPIEDAVGAIWAQTLRSESPARHESFFDLGGHSLLASQLVARLRDVFRVDLSVRDIFEAPTVAGLAQRIEEGLRSGHSSQAPPITRVPRDRELPLSFDQQRLWYLDQLAPGSIEYNVSTVLRVMGRFDLRVLAASLREIIRRHESLRTTFRIVGNHPVQVIELQAAPDLSVADLAALPEPERSRETARLVAEERLRSFDLARGPLLRVRVLRWGPDEHVMQLTAHHIICDGGSAAVFVRELSVFYPAFSQREASPLPELPVQYADFAVWQRTYLQGDILERQLAFWRRRLQGAPVWLDLPLDRPRPTTSAGRGASLETVLPAQLGMSLRQLSAHQGSSLFVTMLAAFEVLLFSLTGQEDFLVGANIAHRNRSELEPLIGFFVNQVALRVDLAGDPTFLDLLLEVRRSTLDAWTFQEVPFEKVVEAVRPERGLGRMPLFQVKIDFDVASEDLELPGLSFRSIDVGLPPVRLDLLLAIQDDGRNLTLTMTYDAELFLPATIQRWMARLESLLGTVAEHPNLRISALTAALQASEREGLAACERELAEASLQKLQRIATRAARPARAQMETT